MCQGSRRAWSEEAAPPHWQAWVSQGMGSYLRRSRAHSQGAPSQAAGATTSLPLPPPTLRQELLGQMGDHTRIYMDGGPISIPPYHRGLEGITKVWGWW